MLQITVHETPNSLTFQLEGRLAGPWVRQLEGLVQRTLASRSTPVIRFDLSDVTLIDVAGKDFLAVMHMEGAEFVACGCLMSGVLTAITEAPVPPAVSRVRGQSVHAAPGRIRREHQPA